MTAAHRAVNEHSTWGRVSKSCPLLDVEVGENDCLTFPDPGARTSVKDHNPMGAAATTSLLVVAVELDGWIGPALVGPGTEVAFILGQAGVPYAHFYGLSEVPSGTGYRCGAALGGFE